MFPSLPFSVSYFHFSQFSIPDTIQINQSHTQINQSINQFHFHFYFQYTPRSDINQSMRSLILHSQKKSAKLRVISREEADFVKGCEISVDFLRVLQSSISTFPSSSPNIECQFHQTSNSSISFVSKRGVCIT